ncbi:Phosphoglucosamine mutase [Chromobacterium violaceum]|uniref:Phosphoglucosamine mutase n=1 Tax=Chromobacterium violaceum TaxID=536 RepID=A0AAX2MD33_CHRVL|nr:Phosphoglucosamine mutase [Chromobacterium violaceum]
MLEHQADFGIALDGDGDRLIMVDAAGRVYDGDQLIYVIAKARAARGELKGGVVGTVMTNMAMELALQKQGVPFGRAKVGDRYVLEMLHADGWQVGGEASGHILCLDKHSTGDGIISSLQVLASLKQLGLSLAEICADWRPFPQTLINVRHNGCDWKAASAAPLAEAEAALQGRGRVVLRPSGTEPVVRVMVEADDKALADTWAKAIAAAIEKVSA